MANYRFRHGEVTVDVQTGRIVNYDVTASEVAPAWIAGVDGHPALVPRRLTDAEAVAISQRALIAACWPGGLSADEVADLMGDNDTSVQINYSPAWHGIPYDGPNGLITLDRQTGLLNHFDLPRNIFAPPPSLTPDGSLAEARLASLRSMLAWRKAGTFRESAEHPLRLVLWQPQYDVSTVNAGEFYGPHHGVRLEPSHVTRLRVGQAILAYSGTLVGSDGYKYFVRLDAQTGLPINMDDDQDPVLRAESGGLPGKPKPALRPAPVPTAARPWRVATGKAGWKAWSAPATAAIKPTATKVVGGQKVTLTDGKLAFAATYDAKANLLGIDGKAYRPSPALASLLRRRPK